MPHTGQRPESLPHAWTAGRMAASRSHPWPKNSESRPQALRKLVGRAEGAAAREEWQLVRRARAGDADALSTLFTRNKTRLYGTAYSLLRNKEDAEDALQCGLPRAYLHQSVAFVLASDESPWCSAPVLVVFRVGENMCSGKSSKGCLLAQKGTGVGLLQDSALLLSKE